MIVTDRDDVAERVRRLRHHGDGGRYQHVELGYASRLDELQAAVLRIKLRRLAGWTEARRRIAERYRTLLAGTPLTLPNERESARHVYYLYTVRHPQRDALAKTLADLGVGTAVHYPVPVPAQPMFGADGARRWPEAWRASREVLSLPCFAELTDDEVAEVARRVRRACESL
jgi:dTDP-4-amino-4,6-dideoxygalactose transaminase